jgi:hypothetical protein
MDITEFRDFYCDLKHFKNKYQSILKSGHSSYRDIGLATLSVELRVLYDFPVDKVPEFNNKELKQLYELYCVIRKKAMV